ncbi:class I SAM-dependent methyltransferase [Streptomyces sp. Wb2n-11]|uniref:class I SAM-dependent methyltransferase n=1 Tax=Streptomyces sp. Wb2n-11 TaxID=1030533 RepID=UPI000A53795D|nr:class I SAM-dependent methyltransferase [Streptomyces sp. Wb2n-11]
MEPRDAAAGSTGEEEEFDRLFSALWSPIGAATVKAARLRPGVHVLDAWCGPGASAIPAAEHVGPFGVIDAVDLAESSLERGRAKAAIHGLANVRFLRGDVLDWPAPRGGYDAVVCALGVSSFPDAAAGTERLLRLIRPGGQLAVAVWSRDALDPLTEVIHRALAPERPSAADVPPPADPLRHLGTSRSLRDWLAARSLSSIDVQYVPLAVPGDPDLLWSLTGTRFRGLLDGLSVAAVERVRRRFTECLLAEGRDTIDASALVGTGTVRRVARPRRPRGARPLPAAGRPMGPVPQPG